MLGYIDEALAPMIRTKPTYDSFRYDLGPYRSVWLSGDGNVLDAGPHDITHVICDNATGEYHFHNGDAVIYVCTDKDDELGIDESINFEL